MHRFPTNFIKNKNPDDKCRGSILFEGIYPLKNFSVLLSKLM